MLPLTLPVCGPVELFASHAATTARAARTKGMLRFMRAKVCPCARVVHYSGTNANRPVQPDTTSHAAPHINEPTNAPTTSAHITNVISRIVALDPGVSGWYPALAPGRYRKNAGGGGGFACCRFVLAMISCHPLAPALSCCSRRYTMQPSMRTEAAITVVPQLPNHPSGRLIRRRMRCAG